jgi:hypothetical protein
LAHIDLQYKEENSKMKHLFKMAVMAVVVIAFMACPIPGDDKDPGRPDPRDRTTTIDWTSATTNPAFGVRNNTSQKLVAFKGSLGPDTILGGIPASAQNHLIKKDPKFFSETQDFAMVLITEEQYNKNKNNLQALQETPFTRVYIFYNHNEYNNEIVYYEISGKLGDGGILRIQNNSDYNVELRQSGVAGQTIGYSPVRMGKIDLGLQTGDIDIYPVFKFFNKIRGTVSTIYPLGDGGKPWLEPMLIEAGKMVTIDIGEIVESIKGRKPALGAAWLVIRNQSSGAIQLTTGNIIYVNALGNAYVNPQNELTFQVDMPSTLGSFAPNTIISGYKVGPNTGAVEIKDSEGKNSFTLETDKMYVVTVTGNVNQGGLTAFIDMEGATSVEYDVVF